MSDGQQRAGLRERKRLAAMHRIQTVALDLFDEHGYDQVTIERIAEQAEVSPSSVYRYFGTKEQLVIWDEYDPVALAAIADELQQRPPIEAVRRVVEVVMGEAVRTDPERIHRRLRLAFTNPSIEAASALQTYEMAAVIGGLIAERVGDTVDDLDVQVFAYACVGALLGAIRHWYASGFTTPFEDIVGRPLAILERGMRLD